jgi:hypothetical protein
MRGCRAHNSFIGVLHLLIIAAEIATLALSVFERSYRPNTGFAAARIEVRALSVA